MGLIYSKKPAPDCLLRIDATMVFGKFRNCAIYPGNDMKYPILLILLIICYSGFAQTGYLGIDYRVQSIEPATAEVLARTLTEPYSEEKQKVRAIFSWIAYHIEYKGKKTNTNYDFQTKTVLSRPMDSAGY